jgi:hypothetical protein
MFNRFSGLIAGGAVLMTGAASAATLSYVGFDVPGDYADNADIVGTTAGENFAGPWTGNANANQFDATATGLTYLNLLTTDGAMDRQSPSAFGVLTRDFAASAQTGSVYFSYLLTNPNDTNTSDRVSFSQGSQERFRIGFTNDEKINIQVQLAGGDGINYVADTTDNAIDFTSPVLVVGEIQINDDVNDTFTVWLNPTDLSDVQGTAAETLSIDVQGVRDLQPGNDNGLFAPIDNLGVRNTARTYTYDEFRIGYGQGADLGQVVPVPSPGSLGVACIGGLMLLIRGRGRGPSA